LKTTIQLPIKKAEYPATSEKIKLLRSYENFTCNTDDSHLSKKLSSKQASELLDRLKTGEQIELKG
jgi:hypothetical protein